MTETSLRVFQERKCCPFYGFSAVEEMKVFMDTKGNQCALVSGSFSPCKMEVDGETPDWYSCSLNTPEIRGDIDNYTDDCMVFPDELRSSKGISLNDWIDKITP